MEKYRPTLVKDIVGNKEAVERLQVVSEEGNMPNIILAVRPEDCRSRAHSLPAACLRCAAAQGPPGTGKTTSVLCLARALLGTMYKEAVLELNASDDR